MMSVSGGGGMTVWTYQLAALVVLDFVAALG